MKKLYMDVEYVVSENRRFGGVITQISNFTYVDVIIENYNEDQLQKFRNSCFAHFEYFHGRRCQFSGKLVHEFLLNTVHTNKGNEVWFKIEGQLCRFGMQEYCLIAGLLCHNNDDSLSTIRALARHRIRRRWFNNFAYISLNELENVFINCDNEEDKYKLGLALLIEGVIRPMERKKINIETLSLVDNLDVCYEYPWGRHAYFTLLRSLLTSWERRALKCIDSRAAVAKYTIYGCPLVFQIWIYEICREVGERFAQKVNDTFPRIVNWDAQHRVGKKELDLFFESTEMHVLPILEPTAEEIEQPYLYTMVLIEDVGDVRVDVVVENFLHGVQENDEIGQGIEPFEPQNAVGPDVVEVHGNIVHGVEELFEGNQEIEQVGAEDVGEHEGWSPYIVVEEPVNNWPLRYVDEGEEGYDNEGVQGYEDQGDQGYEAEGEQGYEYEHNDYYATNQFVQSLFDDQRVYIGDQLGSIRDEQRDYFDYQLGNFRDEQRDYIDNQIRNVVDAQRSYFDEQLGSTRDDLMSSLNQMESSISRNSEKYFDQKKKEMQEYIDTKLVAFEVEHSNMIGSLREDLCSKIESSTLKIEDMLKGKLPEKHAIVGSHTVKQLTAPVKQRADDKDEKKKESVSSIDIPILCDIDEERQVEFLQWMHKSKDQDAVRLRGGSGGIKLTKQKLEYIGNPEYILAVEDMDNAMHLVRKRTANFRDIFSSRYGILDSGFGLLVRAIGSKILDSTGQLMRKIPVSYHGSMERYANGLIPKSFGKNWKNYDHILWPDIIDDKHWVLFDVDLLGWRLTVYDNNYHFYDEAVLYRYVVPAIHIIPDIIQKYVVAERADLGKKMIQPLEYYRKSYVDIPQSIRYSDSGIFVIKYVECLLAGIPIDAVELEKINLYRGKLVIDFFYNEFYFVPNQRNE